MNTNIPYNQGQIVSAARAVLFVYEAVCKADSDKFEILNTLLDTHIIEMLRLLNNTTQLRNDWGDHIQLAMMLIYMAEGYLHSTE